jgi:hypothetical protein
MTLKNLLKAILFAVISAVISTPLQILNSIYVLKDESPPALSFLIPIALIGLLMKTLYAVAYVLLGSKLPIQSEKLRAFTFIIIIWVSDYLPQVLGLIGADGIIAETAFNIPIVICDSLSYILDGILLGFLFKNFPCYEIRKCKKSVLLKTIAISSVLFPLSVFLFEQLLGLFYAPLYIHNAMQVSDTHKILFSISFYGCFIITGILLPLIYRFTEYNNKNTALPFRFGTIYALCIWAPVVLIMIAFGMDFFPVIIFILVFYVCITCISILNGKLLLHK